MFAAGPAIRGEERPIIPGFLGVYTNVCVFAVSGSHDIFLSSERDTSRGFITIISAIILRSLKGVEAANELAFAGFQLFFFYIKLFRVCNFVLLCGSFVQSKGRVARFAVTFLCARAMT